MATIVPTFTKIRSQNGGVDAILVKWALGNADSGQPVQMTWLPDKSIQFDGTFGAATAVLEGSNVDDGTGTHTFVTLNDPTGNALSFTTNGQKAVTEVTAWVRPRTSGGTGTAVTAALLMRRPFR